MLGELAWCFHNELVIAGTPYEVYRRIFELLLLPDCFLLLTSLNTLYNLTILGDQVANNILAVERSLAVLMNLLTLQVESFGEAALAQVKLIDNGSPSSSNKSKGDAGNTTLTSKQVSVAGKAVQVRVVPGGVSLVGVAKQGGGTSLKSSSVSQTPNSGTKPQMLKIGNTIIPTFNLGKKQQEQGGISPSPLLQSSLNPVNPLVKAVLSSSIGPITLDQLQSLLVKSIPTLPQTSAAQKSLTSQTTAQSSVKQADAVTGLKIAQPLASSSLKAVSMSVQPAATSAKPGTANVSYIVHIGDI